MRLIWVGVALALAGCGGPPDIEVKDVRTASPVPPLLTTPPESSPSPPRRGDCVSSTEEATARPGEAPGEVCLIVGATLHVTSTPAPTAPWPALATSDASVLPCKSSTGPDGTLDGGCRAEKPGTAVIGSGTWRLTVHVVA